MAITKQKMRLRRRRRIRGKIIGSNKRPRLSVFRSSVHIYAQVIDDAEGTTLAASSSRTMAAELKSGTKVDVAKKVGQAVAEICKKKGISQVVFDRGGYVYHGRIRAVADGAREAGLSFSVNHG